MRNYRQFVGALVMAVMIAAFLATAKPAFADSGAPGGPTKGTCGFLQGILYKMPADVAESVAVIFDNLFGCDL
jgi:type IV secretory pathway VirB2 component (pilin)